MQNITLTKNDILKELARRDLKYFIKYIKNDYIFSKFSLEVCEALNKFLKDVEQEKRPILIIQAPPQHGKSQLASKYFPAYAFGKNPDLRIAGCSYGSDLAVSVNREVQAIMLDSTYKNIFIGSSLNNKRVLSVDNTSPLRNSERFDIIGHKGYYIACGIGGALTGKSVDIGIIDDPIKNMQEARSDTVKETLKTWYESVFLTRLSKKSGQLIMATRWTLNDLIGVIIDKNKNNDRVKILKYPAIGEDGKALIPELHPLEQLLEFKRNVAPDVWEALYQQNPIISGGNVIKSEWFKTYEILPKFNTVYITADTALKTGQQNDYSVFQLWGKERYELGNNYYLLDELRGKWEVPELEEMFLLFYEKSKKYNCNCIYIEDKASGTGLIQFLKRKNINVVEVKPLKDKYLRLSEVLPIIASGKVYLPKFAEWKLDFLRECEAFTQDNSHDHDDQVDCLSMALNDNIIEFNNLKYIL